MTGTCMIYSHLSSSSLCNLSYIFTSLSSFISTFLSSIIIIIISCFFFFFFFIYLSLPTKTNTT